jgi:hypothetical protein
MRDSYDFSKATRNPYADPLLEDERKGTKPASLVLDSSLDVLTQRRTSEKSSAVL